MRDVKDKCDPQGTPWESMILGFAVKRPPSSPVHRFLHNARCNRLLGPHWDLEEMPPGPFSCLCGSWAPAIQALGMSPVERDTPTGHFHTPCLNHANTLWSPGIHRDSGGKGMVCKNNPTTSSKAPISSSGCPRVCRLPIDREASYKMNFGKRYIFVLTLPLGSRQKILEHKTSV